MKTWRRRCCYEGEFKEGWQEYDWRWRNSENQLTPRHQLCPLGRPFSRPAITFHAEQGFGDTLQFVRFGCPIPRQKAISPSQFRRNWSHSWKVNAVADEVISLDKAPCSRRSAPLAHLPSLLDPNGLLVRDTGAYLSFPQPSPRHPDRKSERNTEIRIGVCWPAGRDMRKTPIGTAVAPPMPFEKSQN